MSEFVQWRWQIGSAITREEHEDAMLRMNVYKLWFLESVMQVGKKNTMVVMQSEDVEPKYRKDPPPPYYIQDAWHQWWLSPVLGAPEIVLPAGQIPYDSSVTKRKEFLPVTASILSQPGSDVDLISMAKEFLESVGRPVTVSSGISMFATGSSKLDQDGPYEGVLL